MIYSDPADDGYGHGRRLSRRARRGRRSGVQRGSVADMTLYPGDPLTPGVGATKDAKRLTREDAPTILKIPALPISYADAQVLLSALGGPVAPASWRGALPITYHVGPRRAAGAPGGEVRLEPEADLRRDRHDEGLATSPTSG